MKMHMIDHAHLVDKIVAKYGPVYATATIPKGVYPNQDKDNQVAAVWNIMAVRDDFSDDLAYKLTKLMLEKREDLGKVHKEALNIVVGNQKSKNAGVPWHPGALKYFAEAGIKVD
jgi:TRAP transporter TAXI family solute receptor